MDVDDAERFLARARQREEEMEKENCCLTDTLRKEEELVSKAEDVVLHDVPCPRGKETPDGHSIYPVEQLKRLSEEFHGSVVDQNQPTAISQRGVNTTTVSAQSDSKEMKEFPKRRSIFSDLAANIDNFEVDLKPKTKTPTTRQSSLDFTGEASASTWFTPNVSYYAPLAVIKSPKKSTGVVGKSDGRLNAEVASNTSLNKTKVAEVITEQPEGSPVTNTKQENVCSNTNDDFTVVSHAESGDDEKQPSGPFESTTLLNGSFSSGSGRESNIKKFFEKQNSECTSPCLSTETKKCEPSPIPKFSEKATVPNDECSVHQLRKDRRRDIVDEITTAVDNATKGLKDLPSGSGRAKEIALKIEERVKSESSETPKIPLSSKRDPVLSMLRKPQSNTDIHNRYRLSVPAAKITQRRATPVIDTTPANVKSLRSRWEVSSSTGAPLHPDQDEDDLLEAARRMSRAIKQSNKWQSRPLSLYDPIDPGSGYFSAKDRVESNTSANCPLLAQDSSTPPNSVENPQTVEVIKEDDKCKKRLNTAGDDEDSENTLGSEKKPKRDEKEESKLSGQLSEALGAFEFLNEASTQNSSLLSSILDNTSETEHAVVADQPKKSDSKKDDTEELPLVHSVSFYRRKKKELKCVGETTVLGQFTTSPPRGVTSEPVSPSKQLSEAQRFAKEKERLEKEMRVQDEQIAQASKALRYCRNNLEFRSSRTEVDAQRALLISKESRRALQAAYDKLVKNRLHSTRKLEQNKPKGTLTVKDISLRLMRDFINGHINYRNDQMMYYFIVLLRHEDTVHHTAMVTSDEGLQSGYVFFPNYIQIKSLPHDFTCVLEVYALKTKRELYNQSVTLKKSMKMPSFHQGYSSPNTVAAVIDPSFQKIGSLVLNIGNITKTKFHLTDVMSPLDGIVTMTLSCFPEETGTIGHKGFLSLYQDVDGIASWTRFWCVLNDGDLSFWKYPEDETKKPIVVINLRDSASEEIRPLGVETCPYPHSMTVDIWVECTQKKGKYEKIRIMMAADTKEDMHRWLDVLNGSLRNITLWYPKR